MNKRVSNLEIVLSVLLLLMPLILILANGEVRPSISNYEYAENGFLFPTLLGIAGTMFITNGTIYGKKWYNIILGASLIGVASTPHLEFGIYHYAFASIFFLGSTAVMIIYSSAKQRQIKIVFASIIILALVGYFAFKWYSLFLAEWICILPIAIHYIGESIGKLD